MTTVWIKQRDKCRLLKLLGECSRKIMEPLNFVPLYYFPLMLVFWGGFEDIVVSSIPPGAKEECIHSVLQDSEAMEDDNRHSRLIILVQQKERDQKRKLIVFMMGFLYFLSFIVKVYCMGFLYISMNDQCMRLLDFSLLSLIFWLFFFVCCWHLHTHTHKYAPVSTCVSQSMTPQRILKLSLYHHMTCFRGCCPGLR